MSTEFTDTLAVRGSVPLLIGLVGASSSGKTYSALRLATGMQRVLGGDIFGIDTEANRMKHYADKFRFRHVPFPAPFGPLRYLEALQYCASKGAKVVIVDSASHMHEGPGGVLEMHDDELTRLTRGDEGKRDKMNFSAWVKPKRELRQFINEMLQTGMSIIFCFRAKDKLKVTPGRPPESLGWMPIAADEFVYEMTLNCLLYPSGGGVPVWKPTEKGEMAIVKQPIQFREVFDAGGAMSEDMGERMARWAAGDSAVKAPSAGLGLGPALLASFAALGVTAIDLATYLGHPVEQATKEERAGLGALGKAIKAGTTTWAAELALKTGADLDDFGSMDDNGAPVTPDAAA